MRTVSYGHRLAGTPRPASLSTRAIGGSHPPQAHHEQRALAGLDSPSTQACHPAPLGAAIRPMRTVSSDHRLGWTPRPPNVWACAGGGCHPP